MSDTLSIYNRMLSLFQEKTGSTLSEDSDLAVRFYAAAAQMEGIYAYCDRMLAQSFPQTAVEDSLDLHAALRGLSRKGALAARGQVEFYMDEALPQPVTVSAGTVLTDGAGQRFFTVEEGVIPVGETSCFVTAEAAEAGKSGNAAALTVTDIVVYPTHIKGVRNPAAFSGGRDREDDESLRTRVLGSFRRLPNGANRAFYEEKVLQHEGVGGVKVLPRVRGAGTVDVVVAAEKGIPEESLLQEIQAELDAVREIATSVAVLAPETVPIDLSVTVWPAEGKSREEAVAAVRGAAESFFDGSLLGESLFLSRLGAELFATGAVKNYVITAPTEDVTVTLGQLPVLNSLTVTEGEA